MENDSARAHLWRNKAVPLDPYRVRMQGFADKLSAIVGIDRLAVGYAWPPEATTAWFDIEEDFPTREECDAHISKLAGDLPSGYQLRPVVVRSGRHGARVVVGEYEHGIFSAKNPDLGKLLSNISEGEIRLSDTGNVLEVLELPERLRGRGLGTEIVGLWEEQKRREGFSNVVVWSYPETHKTWEKLGYVGAPSTDRENTFLTKRLPPAIGAAAPVELEQKEAVKKVPPRKSSIPEPPDLTPEELKEVVGGFLADDWRSDEKAFQRLWAIDENDNRRFPFALTSTPAERKVLAESILIEMVSAGEGIAAMDDSNLTLFQERIRDVRVSSGIRAAQDMHRLYTWTFASSESEGATESSEMTPDKLLEEAKHKFLSAAYVARRVRWEEKEEMLRPAARVEAPRGIPAPSAKNRPSSIPYVPSETSAPLPPSPPFSPKL